ncbi:hypothetical protein GBK02_09070 [Dechloromonas sp. TW-R-39-2]|uniref:hypothetical protein n=1 Tax=Dechloromonas sp. TW-R-39-2 TaxID=2654218 RepID=UPI00193E1A67|nr:hypothetical protein [Dechloromonas sp. TW-R-39-2]QRM19541.1 hypothetical protein GBK02_09070 [Dechloromonas sp. TW-R-39-2]
MFSTAKFLKGRSASSKRAATIIRDLANDSTLTIADRGVMLTCAQIIDGIAAKTSVEAKKKKAAEEQYERDITKARRESNALVAKLPNESILDKVAGNALHINRLDRLTTAIRTESDDKKSLAWELNYWNDQSRSDLSGHIAYEIVRRKVSAESFEADLMAKFESKKSDPVVMSITQRMTEKLEPKEPA